MLSPDDVILWLVSAFGVGLTLGVIASLARGR